MKRKRYTPRALAAFTAAAVICAMMAACDGGVDIDELNRSRIVAFNVNGAKGAKAPDMIVANSGGYDSFWSGGPEITLPADTLKWEGRRFGGWSPNRDGSAPTYAPGAAYTVTEDVILYALWSETAGTVALTANTWRSGVITSYGSEMWYSFGVSSGTTYYVYLNDSDNYGGTLDARIAAYYGSGSGSNIFDADDNVRSFTASSSGTVAVKVYPYSSGGTGTYAVAYNTSGRRP